MMAKVKKEIYSLNSLKAICCIIVILFHCPLPGFLGSLICYFFIFPVPSFFMISGYFCTFENQAYRHRIIETIKYIVFGELFYVAVKAILVLMQGGNPFDIILIDMPFPVFVRTILFGTFYNGPLWFLYALLWTWILFWGLSSICQRKGIKISILLQRTVVSGLLATLIFGWMICQYVTNINDWVWIFRSCVLFAVPFVWIGKYIKRFEQELLEKFNPKVCLIAIFGAYVMALFEVLLAYRHSIAHEIYLSTVFIAFFVFLLMLHFQGQHQTILSRMGKNYSAYVYICHGACIRIVESIGVGGVIKPILVIILSLASAVLCHNTRRMLRRFSIRINNSRKK